MREPTSYLGVYQHFFKRTGEQPSGATAAASRRAAGRRTKRLRRLAS
ncbi:hypothetical protein [Streptomyces coeruleorubidus]